MALTRAAVRLAAILGVTLAGLLVIVAGPVRAADPPTFGPPEATEEFLSAIRLREQVTLPDGVVRIDALVQSEGSERTLATPVTVPGAGQATLTYEMLTPSGALMPNTEVTLRFRVTLADGTTALGPIARIRYDDTRFAWNTISGPVVRVHWVEGDQAFGRRALDIAETAITNASSLLGVHESDPIDFFIYADGGAFRDVIGPALQENIGGRAVPGIRTLVANIASTDIGDAWVANVVPHELTHLVFDTATANPYHAPAHWLNEGLATYLAIGYDAGARGSVRAAVANRSLMPLSSLQDSFPGSSSRFSLAYDEAVSAIDFLVRTHGRDALVKVVRSYADGLTDDEAFTAGIGDDTASFERAWLADLGAAVPSPFGPRPAPAGPVPSGWSGAGPTAGLANGSPIPGDGGASLPGVAGIIGVVVLLLGVAAVAYVLAYRATARRRPPP